MHLVLNIGLNVKSYYVTSVWAFMSFKWSFALYHRSKKYQRMFTRYVSLQESEPELISD